MNKPSILFLSHEFPPLGGGAGLNGFYLCEELHKRGWSVCVVTQRPPCNPLLPLPFPITYITSFRTRRLQTKFSSMLFFIIGAIRFRRAYRGRFDFVFSNMAIPAGIAGALIRAVWKTPHIIWHHGGDVHAGKQRGAGVFQRMLLRSIWKGAFLNCFVSEGLRSLACAYGNTGKTAILPVTPRLRFFPDAATPPRQRPFLFLGRLEKVKNPLLLVAAMEALKKLTPSPPPLIIMGDGRLYGKLHGEIYKRQLKNLITLRKDISHDHVSKALQSAYALICPSRIEGYNMTILEAAQCGVPAIGSDVPEINSIIQHRKNGLLFESDNPEQLAICIKELYENPSLRDILGKNAAQTASAFSIERSVDIFEALCAGR